MWGSLPIRPIFAFWVEISGRWKLESLPFSADFRCLGRDMRPVEVRISTFSPDFCILGRDMRPAGLVNLYLFQLIFAVWVEISDKRHQESLPFWPISAVWVEISGRRHLESLPFSADFRCLGRDIRQAALGISTFLA